MTESEDIVLAVHMSHNSDPKVKSQWSDVGKPFDEVKKAAELYAQTSRYNVVEIVELRVIYAMRVK